MITVEQIRAARGLLNWTRKDLAEKSGLSLPGLNNLERQIVTPRARTLDILRQTFEREDIEFLGSTGVQKRGEYFEFKRFQGRNFIDHIDHDIMGTVNRSTEFIGVGIDETQFPKFSSDKDGSFINYMTSRKIKTRQIVATGTHFFAFSPATYRYLPPEMIGVIYWLSYADRYVMINWQRPAHALWIRNRSIAESHQRQFEVLWRLGTKIPDHVVKKTKD